MMVSNNVIHYLLQWVFGEPTLNGLMSLTSAHWGECRSTLRALLASEGPERRLRENAVLRQAALVGRADVRMHLPADIGDYTDFYSSLDHATNIGTMFRYGYPTNTVYR